MDGFPCGIDVGWGTLLPPFPTANADERNYVMLHPVPNDFSISSDTNIRIIGVPLQRETKQYYQKNQYNVRRRNQS